MGINDPDGLLDITSHCTVTMVPTTQTFLSRGVRRPAQEALSLVAAMEPTRSGSCGKSLTPCKGSTNAR